MSNQWRKIKENYFLYVHHKNEKYVIRTLPFKILKFETIGQINDDIIANQIVNKELSQMQKKVQTAPQSYYLPLVIVTNACNLMCKYCYAENGSYGMAQKVIAAPVIDKVLDMTKDKLLTMKGKERIDFGLILFGGEPTLAFRAIKYAVNKTLKIARELSKPNATIYNPIITINTNALSLSNEFFKLVRKYKSNLELIVSYDGLWHDENRVDKNKAKTAERVEKNISSLLEAGAKVDITMVVPPEKMGFFKENVEYVTGKFGREININPSFVRGAIPAVKRKAVYPGVLEQNYTEKIVKKWGLATKKLILEGYNIYWKRFQRRIFEGGYLYRCPAMLYEFCVTPNGGAYPCHNLTEKKFKLGNVLNAGFFLDKRKSIINLFLRRQLDKISPCKDCLFQTICLSSFDCPAHSLHDLGNFFKVDNRFCPAAKEIMGGLLQRFITELNKDDKK